MAQKKTSRRRKQTESRFLNDGFLVVGNVSVRGCVYYSQQDKEVLKDDGTQLEEEWQTHKTVEDISEHKAALKERGSCWWTVAKLGTYIAGFGFFVPAERGNEIEEALRECNDRVQVYNEDATCTSLNCSWAVFAISGGNEQLAKAIYDRMADTLNEVSVAMNAGDVKGLRNALTKLGYDSNMLPAAQLAQLNETTQALRAQATAAMKKVKKDGITATDKIAAEVKKHVTAVPINATRTALVEVCEEIDEQIAKVGYLPSVDVKSIEVSSDL